MLLNWNLGGLESWNMPIFSHLSPVTASPVPFLKMTGLQDSPLSELLFSEQPPIAVLQAIQSIETYRIPISIWSKA